MRRVVRQAKVRKSANSVVTDSPESSYEADSSSKIFSSNSSNVFFSTIAPNDRGYGHLAVCGSIRCRETTK